MNVEVLEKDNSYLLWSGGIPTYHHFPNTELPKCRIARHLWPNL